MDGLQIALLIIVIVVFIVLVIVLWVISTINSFRRMQIKINESESGIDVALTKRFDLLTKLFQAVKGSMKHEQETLAKIVKMRTPEHNAPISEKQDFANKVTGGLDAINVVLENYPDLKAAQNILQLQKSTAEVEENLSAIRRIYNSNVSIYNQKLAVFPSNIIANSKKLTKKDFFVAEETKKQDVKFDF